MATRAKRLSKIENATTRRQGRTTIWVKEIMSRDLCIVSPELDIYEALRTLVETAAPCLIVLDQEQRPIGIVTDRDLLALAMEPRDPIPSVALRQILQDEGHTRSFLRELGNREAAQLKRIMSCPAVCADAEMTLGQAATVMAAFSYKQLPVTADGALVGVLTRSDLLRALLYITT
jgi:CBS domain-containing protein